MAWDDKNPANDEKVKDPIYRSTGGRYYFAVFRIGRKYKNIGVIKAFQAHMERKMNVPNRDKNISNIRLIGNEDVYGSVWNKIQGIKIRSNAVIGRELLLTASHDFFKMSDTDLYKWVDVNRRWLEKEFGSNCVYAVLHLDETTPHIHAMIVPEFINEKGQRILSNTRYFDGIEKMRGWQDNYSAAMKEHFPALNRGIRNSKAKHIEIRHFYGIINNVKARENAEDIFKHNLLLRTKLKGIEATMNAYNTMLTDKENNIEELKKLNQDLQKQVKDIKKDNELYKRAVKQLSQTYKLPEGAIKKVFDYCRNNGNERTR